MTANLYAIAAMGITMVAIGVILVWVSSRGKKETEMALQRKVEMTAQRIDAHGNVTAEVEFVARHLNGTVYLEFHGERSYRFAVDADAFTAIKEL